MSDRKDRSIHDRIESREFDDAKVRAYLDTLDLDALRWKLGEPRIVTLYAQPIGYWHQGDGRPMLADEDPAVMQAIGRCATARRDAGPIESGAIHGGRCGWCEYPAELLLGACDWAIWHSRFVVTELAVWADHDEPWVSYEREVRSSVYDNPAWATFWALPRAERRQRVERAQGLVAA